MKKIILLFAIGFLLSNAKAQIIYTDVNPDTIISAGSSVYVTYDLNLNNDGPFSYDFVLASMDDGSTRQVEISSAYYSGNCEVLWDGSRPYALAFGENIDNNRTIWTSANSAYLNQTNDPTCHWIGVTNKYLGLRFQISGQWHYGWARLDIPADATQFTLKDYAYNSVANQAITAGNNGTGMQENNLPDDITVYAYNKTLFVDIKDNVTKDGLIKLYNLMGQEIMSVTINNSQMEVNVEDVNTGIYLCNIYNNNGMISRKINIQ